MTSNPDGRGGSGGTGIGRALRAARAERGLSLGELETRTKIRVAHLAAFEDERFEDLPPYPYARGFLHTLALELELDPAPLERSFADRVLVSGGLAENWGRLDGAVIPAVPPSRLRRIVMTAGLAILVAGTAAGAFLFQQFRQFGEPAPPPGPAAQEDTAQPSPSSELPVGPASPQPPAPSAQQSPAPPPRGGASPMTGDATSPADRASAAGTQSPESPAPDSDAVVVGGPRVALDVQASGRSWLRVVIDGQTAFEGFMTAGERRHWQGSAGISVRVGNAGAIAVTVNGRALGALGRPGEVIDQTFVIRERR